MLLKYKDMSSFPDKLDEMLSNKPNIKWVMRENDIEIDIDCINEVCIDIFNDMFTDDKCISKLFGKDYANVIVASHKNLDCYMMFKTIKWAYGSSNCKNLWKEQMTNNRQDNLIALNDEIAKNIRCKSKLNHDATFKQYAYEVKDYLDMKLKLMEFANGQK